MLSVDAHLKVQMVAAADAGAADIANDIALMHGRALINAVGICRHVSVKRAEPPGVADTHTVAVAPVVV